MKSDSVLNALGGEKLEFHGAFIGKQFPYLIIMEAR